jgi:hypothetical protein
LHGNLGGMDPREWPEIGVDMARTVSNILTVSPPNLGRTRFLALEQAMTGSTAPTGSDWLLQRFEEGHQVRILRTPERGYIEFAPGRISWRAINGADHCVVVQCLHADGTQGGVDLLQAAEDWARYFDFFAVMVLAGAGPCLLPSDVAIAAGYSVVGETEEGVSLYGKILQGPVPLPSLPQNWQARRAALGPGLVVQCLARSPERLEFARDLVARANSLGLSARVDLVETALAARNTLVTPASPFSVVLNGLRIDDGQGSDFQIWQSVRQCAASSPY